eukprot:SAG22_NODE_3583_length_1632_cov_2.097195_1_plen_102_part_00
MDKARPVEADLLKLLADQKYRELALAYELEGKPVPAHVAAEANHLAVVAALVGRKALSFCRASAAFLSKPVPFRVVCPALPTQRPMGWRRTSSGSWCRPPG